MLSGAATDVSSAAGFATPTSRGCLPLSAQWFLRPERGCCFVTELVKCCVERRLHAADCLAHRTDRRSGRRAHRRASKCGGIPVRLLRAYSSQFGRRNPRRRKAAGEPTVPPAPHRRARARSRRRADLRRDAGQPASAGGRSLIRTAAPTVPARHPAGSPVVVPAHLVGTRQGRHAGSVPRTRSAAGGAEGVRGRAGVSRARRRDSRFASVRANRCAISAESTRSPAGAASLPAGAPAHASAAPASAARGAPAWGSGCQRQCQTHCAAGQWAALGSCGGGGSGGGGGGEYSGHGDGSMAGRRVRSAPAQQRGDERGQATGQAARKNIRQLRSRSRSRSSCSARPRHSRAGAARGVPAGRGTAAAV